MKDEEIIAKVRASIEAEMPYLIEIERMVKDVQNGVIELTLRVYNGRVTDILEGKRITRKTFKTPKGSSQ